MLAPASTTSEFGNEKKAWIAPLAEFELEDSKRECGPESRILAGDRGRLRLRELHRFANGAGIEAAQAALRLASFSR
jgi:hypothetical protein